MADGRQVLAAVESTALGLKVGEPVSMLALSESETGSFELNHVRLDQSAILHGPVEQVMVRSAGGGAGSLATSALALGAAAGNLHGCHEELTHRTAQRTYMEPLEAELHSLTAALHATAPPIKSDELRRRANLLAIRSAQFWLAVTKGAGFVTGHPQKKLSGEPVLSCLVLPATRCGRDSAGTLMSTRLKNLYDVSVPDRIFSDNSLEQTNVPKPIRQFKSGRNVR